MTAFLEELEPNPNQILLIHGKLEKRLRYKVVEKFKSNGAKMLITTDHFARFIKIKIPDIDLVVNYDLPAFDSIGQDRSSYRDIRNYAEYIHRIGMCARWERKGVAISLVSLREIEHVRAIEEYWKCSIEEISCNDIANLDDKIYRHKETSHELENFEHRFEERIKNERNNQPEKKTPAPSAAPSTPSPALPVNQPEKKTSAPSAEIPKYNPAAAPYAPSTATPYVPSAAAPHAPSAEIPKYNVIRPAAPHTPSAAFPYAPSAATPYVPSAAPLVPSPVLPTITLKSISKWQQKLKEEKERQEVTETEIWKLKKIVVKRINKLQKLEVKKKLEESHNPNGILFLCSAKGIGNVALKMLFNTDIDETSVLKSIPIHKNIIPIFGEFADRPSDAFFHHFTSDMQKLVSTMNDTRRMTHCILMPFLSCFKMQQDFSIGLKLEFVSDILEGLCFLFEHNIVHLDMKLNHLLVNATGRVVICDFGCAKALNAEKKAFISQGGLLGGNMEHLAPEIKIVNNRVPQWVDYSKQPSFELGMLAHEIIFGQTPRNTFGEEMSDQYFRSLCPNPAHNNGKLFEWLKALLTKNKANRLDLKESKQRFEEIIEEQRKKDLMAEYFEGVSCS